MRLGYTKNDQPDEAIKLFREVERSGLLREETLNDPKADGIDERIVIYLCVIDALTQCFAWEMLESIVKDMPPELLVHPRIQNALMDMWVSGHTVYP